MEPYKLYRKWHGRQSTLVGRQKNSIRFLLTITTGIIIGFCIGVSFSYLLPITKLNITSTIVYDSSNIGNKTNSKDLRIPSSAFMQANTTQTSNDERKIWVPTNPKGAESLPPGIVTSESDLYLRRLWGNPNEDLTMSPTYLVAFAVGYDQRHNVDAAVKKFSDNFTVMLFHYDEKTSEWDEFEWSKRAIHVSARQQTKWWFAKRFLHPDIVAPYDYIFIWDEDLGVENFDAEKYIDIVRNHELEISQPAIQANKGISWEMTKRRDDVEVHVEVQDKGLCKRTRMPPCAAFVEIMAPVFSRVAWRCVWHMIQNDLVHGWGLDFALERCVHIAHERIGVVDAQWIVHQEIPSLRNQGQAQGEGATSKVSQRCHDEWAMFTARMEKAEKVYYKSIGIDPPNFTP